MRIFISVTDEKGNVFEGSAVLTLTKAVASAKEKRLAPSRGRRSATLDFSSSLQHFMRTHAKGLSGPKKFALLVAHLTGGNSDGKVVEFDNVENAWNRIKRLLGPYNPAYSTRAKDYGWVESPKQGQYSLGKNWQSALSN